MKNFCYSPYWLVYTRSPRHANRVSRYREFENKLDMTGILYLVEINKIDRFKRQNVNVSVNVFGYEGNVYPLRISEHRERACHVNLILLSDSNGSIHYSLIRNMSRLLLGLTKSAHKRFYCYSCLQRFSDRYDQTLRGMDSNTISSTVPSMGLRK